MKQVFVVLKNADFTEGRGPMLFHKVFEDVVDAVVWTMAQPGIFGSKQEETIPPRRRDGRRSFNGYELVPTPVIPRGAMDHLGQSRAERDRLQAEKDQIEARLRELNNILD